MLVSRVEVENFRVLGGVSLSDLPPIVGIWGPNGCGKSALLQAIVALKNLPGSGYGTSPPAALNSGGLLLGEWDTVVFQGLAPGKRLRIQIWRPDGSSVAQFERTEEKVVLDVPNRDQVDFIRYFPPRRTLTSRSANLNQYSPEGLSLSPNRIHAYLHWFLHEKVQERIDSGKPNEFDDLNRWMEKFGFGTLSDRAKPGPTVEVTSLFRDRATGYTSATIDGGYGGNSMLPLILEAYSFRDGLLLVEEPEMSLHPGAQAEVFDFFVEMARSRGHQIIFTSHSEYLLRRFARYRKDGHHDPEISVLVAHKDEKGGHIEPKDIDDLVKKWEAKQDLLPELHRR